MQYKCRTIPLIQLQPTNKGYFKPLCITCQSKDCENPIQFQDVSICGVTEKQRCWVSWMDVSIVVQCEGYIE